MEEIENKYLKTSFDLYLETSYLVDEYNLPENVLNDEGDIASLSTHKRIWQGLKKRELVPYDVDSASSLINPGWTHRGEEQAAEYLGLSIRQFRRLGYDYDEFGHIRFYCASSMDWKTENVIEPNRYKRKTWTDPTSGS